MNKQLLMLSICSIATIMLLSGMQNVSAAGYLKIGDIKGESTDDGHKDWIDLLSVSHEISRDSTGKSHRSSTTFGDIVLVKEVDASTPKLQESIATGKYIPSVIIDFTRNVGTERPTEVPYLQYELKQVQITSYSFSGATQSDTVPTEQISLNFEEIKVTYTQYDEQGKKKGNIEYSWKVEKGEK